MIVQISPNQIIELMLDVFLLSYIFYASNISDILFLLKVCWWNWRYWELRERFEDFGSFVW